MLRSVEAAAAPRLLAIAILAAAAGWLATTSLQQDFAAYYTAGAAAGRGLDPYVNHLPEPDGPWDGMAAFRHSRFLYPPLVAQLFRPLAALPFAWAKVIFSLASIAGLVVGLDLVARDRPETGAGSVSRATQNPTKTATTTATTTAPAPGTGTLGFGFLFLACAIWLPVLLTLERGQIDLLLLAALATAWHWRDRPLVAGPVLAVAAMGKPFILGVVPLLVVGRRFRWAAATVGGVVLLGGVNVAVCGREVSQRYLGQVLPRVVRHGEGGTDAMLLTDAEVARAGDDWETGVAHIDGKGRAWAQEVGSFPRNASLPRLLAGGDPPPTWLPVLVYVALFAALAIGAWRAPDSALWYWGGLVAAVVATPVSWTMSLVWALPLFWLIGLDQSQRRHRRGSVGGPDGDQYRRDDRGDDRGDPRRDDRLAGALATVAFAAGMLGPLGSAAWVAAGLAAVAAAVAVARTMST